MASRGHRVLAFAQALLPESQYPKDYPFSKTDYPSDGYCFSGLISLEDPPKHGVREAIGALRLAGIKVMMITGRSHNHLQGLGLTSTLQVITQRRLRRLHGRLT